MTLVIVEPPWGMGCTKEWVPCHWWFCGRCTTLPPCQRVKHGMPQHSWGGSGMSSPIGVGHLARETARHFQSCSSAGCRLCVIQKHLAVGKRMRTSCRYKNNPAPPLMPNTMLHSSPSRQYHVMHDTCIGLDELAAEWCYWWCPHPNREGFWKWTTMHPLSRVWTPKWVACE